MSIDFDKNKKIGISGCELTIIDSNIVRKTSKTLDYNQRLINQTKKQLFFKSLKNLNINTPTVLKTGYTSNYFYFDMEYVVSELPFDFFLLSNIDNIKSFTNSIQNYLNFIKKNSKTVDIIDFKEKTIKKLNELKSNSHYTDFIKFIIDEVNHIKIKSFQSSFCHGDLTLSNILCQNENVYFIDLLDSFIETPMIDIIKLKQDLVYLWSISLLKKYNLNETLKLSQICNYIWGIISEKNQDLIDNELFDILESINYLRIEPYVKNEDLRDTLTSIIKKTNLYEKFNNPNGRKIK